MELQRIQTQSTASYADLNRLQKMKVGEERDSEANIRAVAQEFESLFIAQMLKSMRAAGDVLADDSIFNSNESKTYRDMHDQQLSIDMAKGGGIGIANVLVRQMTQTLQPRAGSNPFADMQSANPEPDKVEPVAAEVGDEGINLRRRSFAAVPAMPAGAANLAQPTSRQAVAAVQEYAGLQADAALASGEFASPQAFVNAMLPMARQAARELGVEPHLLVAQAALETGWGKHMPRDAEGNSTNNLFGIKAHGWSGVSARAVTNEFVEGKKVTEQADFRQYGSFAQSFSDYVHFLRSNGRYQQALQVTGDPQQFLRELQRAGYATDPRYAEKIGEIATRVQNYQQTAYEPAVRLAERG